MNDRVSMLELFFDLVFVFTITQVARLVYESEGAAGVGQAALLLTIAFWMYGGYAWLTNNIGTQGLTLRLLMLLGMGAYLVMALAIPRAAGDDGVTFGVAFTIVTIVHGVLFTKANNSSARAIFEIAPYNLTAAALTIVAGFLPPERRWIAWLAAVGCFLTVTLRRRERHFQVSAAHFAERHGLVIIVAIGESVVALGSGVSHMAVSAPLIAVVGLGFTLCAAIWWTYFDADDERGAKALDAAPPDRRLRLAIFAYSDAHLGMVAGIVCIAAGLQGAIAALGGPMAPRHAWMLAGGVALYLACDKVFRYLLQIGSSRWRSAAAALALAMAPIGWRWSSGAQIGGLVGALVVTLAMERKRGRT